MSYYYILNRPTECGYDKRPRV